MITQETIPYTADEIKAMVKTCEKYNKALERARVYHTGGSISDAHITEVIFPELVDSEDERIRKEIISFLKDFEKDHYRSVNFNSWIAWLEKQGEPEDKGEISTSVNVQKKKATGVLGEMIANINPESLQKTKEQMIAEVEQQIKKCIGMILTDADERRFEDFDVTLKECLDWLEKQDTNKEYVFRPVAGTTIETAIEQALEQGDVVLAFNGFYTPVKGKTSEEILAEYNHWLEKQNEQPTDKIAANHLSENPCSNCTNTKGCIICVDGDQKSTSTPRILYSDEVIEWLNHRELSYDDVVTTVIPDDSPTSIPQRVKWLSDEFINKFKKDFKL